jgi:hypothetical protein
MKTISQHILFSIIGVLVIGLAISGINLYRTVSDIQASKEPVVSNMIAVGKRETSTYMDLHIFGDKNREGCGAPISWAASYGYNVFNSFLFLDDVKEIGAIKTPDAKSVGNRLDFGWWRFSPNPEDKSILVKIFHLCGEFTVISEFILTPSKIKD